MSHAKFVGRLGALVVALGIGFAATVAPGAASAEPAGSGDDPPVDRIALIMGGTTIPTPDEVLVDIIKNQYIAPTYPGKNITYVPVTTPEEGWPITGFLRVAATLFGPSSIWGPGRSGWPDQTWWKLSGLFDLTLDQSVREGVADLELAMAEHGTKPLVIYGVSQGAIIETLELRKLAEQYAEQSEGTEPPDIDFVMQATPNLPNGGLFARFPGFYLPVLDWSFSGPAPTDAPFDAVVINRQYDFFSDFPLYPLNLVADLNALLGGFYIHTNPTDVSLASDPSSAYQGTYGRTSYYTYETQDLPLFGPLRSLGVPESWIDVVEPLTRVIVELGYDRAIKPWEPAPAQLFPKLDPAKVASDLVAAVDQGITNAMAIFGLPVPAKAPAAPTRETAKPKSLNQLPSKPDVAQDNQLASEQPADVAKPDEVKPVTLNHPAPKPDPKVAANVSKPHLANLAPRPARQRPEVGAPMGPRDKQSPKLPHRKTDGGQADQKAPAAQTASAAGTTSDGPSA